MNKWISVKDRLPENDMLYVIVTDGETSITAQYSKKTKDFFNIYGQFYLTASPVTYWMPLPEPPKNT